MPRVMDPMGIKIGVRIGADHQAAIPDLVSSGVRIGADHQAEIPDLVSSGPCPESVPEHAVALWCPNDAIHDKKLEKFINMAKQNHGFNEEQALELLFGHNYKMKKTIAKMKKFKPYPLHRTRLRQDSESGYSTEDSGIGYSTEDCRIGYSTEDCRIGYSTDDSRIGHSTEDSRIGYSAEDSAIGYSTEDYAIATIQRTLRLATVQRRKL